MVKATGSLSINLAKNRGEKFVDRFFKWALTIGRGLVILTEAIALGTFLYRFGLDRQVLDLHDKIRQEQAIVKLLRNNETIYRNLQDRLTLAKTVNTQLNQEIDLYTTILSAIPTDMTLKSLSISQSNIQLNGTIPSLISLNALVKKMKTLPNVAKVSLDKLENRVELNVLSFTITIFLKQQSTQKSL